MSVFVTKWKIEVKKQIELARPDLTEKQIMKYLDKVIEKNLVNPECHLDNNYRKKKIRTNLLSIYDWVDATHPIIGGYGVFYKNQHQSVNNVARAIRKFLDTRTILKDTMKSYDDPECYEYKHYDMLQAGEKVCANAIYGASGAKVSIFYNLYTAASTTGTAQSLISTTCAAFESFMENGTKFYDTDEAIHFIKNIVNEKHSIGLKGIKLITKEQCLSRLIRTHFKPKKANVELLDRVLSNLTQEEWTRVYYKNNLYEFVSGCREVTRRLRKAMLETETFRAPKEKLMTPQLRTDLNVIWQYLSEFVHYNHPIYNRIYRLKTSKRKSVLVIDTDSNMVSIYNWINMIMSNFVDERNTQPEEESIYTAASIICVFITNMIRCTLDTYCKHANVIKEIWEKVNMKNEFFFETLITTDVKKNYLSSVLLREGNPMFGKVDIKGLAFMKSVISEEVGDYFKSIVKEDILGAHIAYSRMISKLNALSDKIRNSLEEGYCNYGKPMSIKDPDKYKEPLSEMGVRAVMGYNSVYQDNPIELPEHVYVLKVNMQRAKDIEPLKDTYPDVYESLMREIYNNPNKQISSKGLNAFAVPQIAEKMPEWLIQFVDIDTIIEDNTKSFFPVLKSLSLEIINTKSDRLSYSNIVKL
jgi:hypothetical protein